MRTTIPLTLAWLRLCACFLVIAIGSSAADAQPYPADDEDMEDYDEGMGGYGGPSRQANAAPTPTFGRLGNLAPLLIASDPSLEDPRPTLRKQTDEAFLAGRFETSLELFFGHLAADYEKATESLRSVKYSPIMKRPVWQVRWGLSLFVRGDDVSDRSPIREGGGAAFRAGGRGRPGASSDYGSSYESSYDSGMSDMEDDGFGGPPPASGFSGRQAADGMESLGDEMLDTEANRLMDETLGLVAEVTASEFVKRFQRGDFGAALAGIAPSAAEPSGPALDGLTPAQIAAMTSGQGQMTPEGMRMMQERQRMQQQGGGSRMSEDGSSYGSESMYDSESESMYGSSSESESMYGEDYGSEYGSDPYGRNQAPPPAPEVEALALGRGMEPFPMWQPGIVFIGEKNANDALADARKAGIDFLLHFEVILKQNRAEQVQNVSRCRLVRVSDAKTLGISKAVDSFEAYRKDDSELEYTREQIMNLFAIIDNQLALVDLPTLSSEIAKRRLTSLFSGRKANRLAALAEIRLYQSQGLISDEEAEKAFYIAGGPDALTIMHGTTDDRIETVHQWVTQALTGE